MNMIISTLLVSTAIAGSGAFTIDRVPETPEEVAAFDGIVLDIDRTQLAGMRDGERIVINDVPMPGEESVSLELIRFNVFSEDARVVVGSMDDDGEVENQPMDFPDVITLRGRIVGDPDSRVFLGLGDRTTNGLIERPGQTCVIARHPDAGWTAIYDLGRVDPALMNWVDVTCGVESIPQIAEAPRQAAPRGIDTDCPPRLRLAIETDWQFTGNLFGGDVIASGEYAATLVAAMSSIYIVDLEVAVQISYLRLWADAMDPWTGGSSGDQLNEFVQYWNANMGDVSRHLAHMFSGQNLGGGVAYVGVVCSPNYGYAVSGNLGGSFPLPIQDHSGNNWDLMVVCHETGHNCGTGHTHDYNPPIDGCGNGDCELAYGGTIMSYCHLCSGGISNMVMSFHPTVQINIENYLAGVDCDLGGDGSPPSAQVDNVTAVFGTSFDIDVLLNDYTNDCTDPVIVEYDPISYAGATIQLVGDDPASAVLRYVPGSEEVDGDIFQYSMSDGSGQQDSSGVIIDFINPRPPDTPLASEPGVQARYYTLQDPTVLPDFDTLEPYADEYVDQVNYPSTGGNFAGSGLSDNFGVVFEGLVDIPEAGTYTFYVNSDDGSRLFIGDEQIVDNDGLHGMNEESGSILLGAGLHEIRIDFFERGGGAGCIVSIAGGSLSKQPIPVDMWAHATTIPEDVTGDGVINLDDILLVLAEWGPCGDPCPGDVNGDSVIDINDILAILAVWPT